jgi:hypothetical protein
VSIFERSTTLKVASGFLKLLLIAINESTIVLPVVNPSCELSFESPFNTLI